MKTTKLRKSGNPKNSISQPTNKTRTNGKLNDSH